MYTHSSDYNSPQQLISNVQMEVVQVGLQLGLAKDPPAKSLTSTVQVDLGVQLVDIHSKICRTSLLPYRY